MIFKKSLSLLAMLSALAFSISHAQGSDLLQHNFQQAENSQRLLHFKDYQCLLADEVDPISLNRTHNLDSIRITFKLLVADPDNDSFSPEWTKLKQYFNEEPIEDTNICHMIRSASSDLWHLKSV